MGRVAADDGYRFAVDGHGAAAGSDAVGASGLAGAAIADDGDGFAVDGTEALTRGDRSADMRYGAGFHFGAGMVVSEEGDAGHGASLIAIWAVQC